MQSVLEFVKTSLKGVLSEGDMAVDATLGNGYDTLFLSRCVGASGRVHAFDIQAQALDISQQRLSEAGMLERVRLYLAGHETMANVLPPETFGRVRAVTFNLGYLPGGDKTLTTQAATSLAALKCALRILAPGGLISVVLYPGHDGATAECEAVLDWAGDLPQKQVEVLRYGFLNQKNSPPFLLLLQRRGELPT
jgi:ubiquinone/menaquinone biosynthesis C-methylase UbiE